MDIEMELDYSKLLELDQILKYLIENRLSFEWLADDQRDNLLNEDDTPQFIDENISMILVAWYKLGRYPNRMVSLHGLNEVSDFVETQKAWEQQFLTNINSLFKQYDSLRTCKIDSNDNNDDNSIDIITNNSNENNVNIEKETITTNCCKNENIEKSNENKENSTESNKESNNENSVEEKKNYKNNQFIDNNKLLVDKVKELITSQLNLDRLLNMLGMRKTVGSSSAIPHGPVRLMNSANLPHTPGSASRLSVSARAFCKHANRSENSFWGSGKGPELDKNQRSEKTIIRILRDSTWINMHALPHNIIILEVRCSESYGLRWGCDGNFFRGTLEPMMESFLWLVLSFLVSLMDCGANSYDLTGGVDISKSQSIYFNSNGSLVDQQQQQQQSSLDYGNQFLSQTSYFIPKPPPPHSPTNHQVPKFSTPVSNGNINSSIPIGHINSNNNRFLNINKRKLEMNITTNFQSNNNNNNQSVVQTTSQPQYIFNNFQQQQQQQNSVVTSNSTVDINMKILNNQITPTSVCSQVPSSPRTDKKDQSIKFDRQSSCPTFSTVYIQPGANGSGTTQSNDLSIQPNSANSSPNSFPFATTLPNEFNTKVEFSPISISPTPTSSDDNPTSSGSSTASSSSSSGKTSTPKKKKGKSKSSSSASSTSTTSTFTPANATTTTNTTTTSSTSSSSSQSSTPLNSSSSIPNPESTAGSPIGATSPSSENLIIFDSPSSKKSKKSKSSSGGGGGGGRGGRGSKSSLSRSSSSKSLLNLKSNTDTAKTTATATTTPTSVTLNIDPTKSTSSLPMPTISELPMTLQQQQQQQHQHQQQQQPLNQQQQPQQQQQEMYLFPPVQMSYDNFVNSACTRFNILIAELSPLQTVRFINYVQTTLLTHYPNHTPSIMRGFDDPMVIGSVQNYDTSSSSSSSSSSSLSSPMNLQQQQQQLQQQIQPMEIITPTDLNNNCLQPMIAQPITSYTTITNNNTTTTTTTDKKSSLKSSNTILPPPPTQSKALTLPSKRSAESQSFHSGTTKIKTKPKKKKQVKRSKAPNTIANDFVTNKRSPLASVDIYNVLTESVLNTLNIEELTKLSTLLPSGEKIEDIFKNKYFMESLGVYKKNLELGTYDEYEIPKMILETEVVTPTSTTTSASSSSSSLDSTNTKANTNDTNNATTNTTTTSTSTETTTESTTTADAAAADITTNNSTTSSSSSPPTTPTPMNTSDT
ncbi:hypothetical protein PPL_10173 [Heterostelium album PN500]|uniref:ASX DEUBAD domain-containing protein n=1 Tax=Heterostelium pallidum (strain ATCC 26659 / Pp 5 / PN500) TaxID=670386 RepID=D3BQI8_HETP5|nr:hypothetical protein PPL_10173 [Heterostelium album PN500]EFA76408.1 hypothetical protein PPL_10173 [Heterostelium album PN500]|eukprot:XP_020428540.1 hypothetical protein PPL_10173 [Heterostelium album PN500]